ncbi:MAG TPA: hypothetical protein DCM08_11380, partial [Microscillaceae bacterium]|nr:hypothetical protein [Microscillaceae bacterium]
MGILSLVLVKHPWFFGRGYFFVRLLLRDYVKNIILQRTLQTEPIINWCFNLIRFLMKKLAYFLFFFSAFEALCGLYFPLAAQDFDALEGIPYIRNYSPKDYRADFQNWTILQDKRGIMYFGNNEGVLEFDGAFWRLIQMPNKSVVRSLAIDKDGTIYVGAAGELGLLQANAKGQMVYQSLKSKLPAANQNFADVWRVIPTQAGVIFQTFNEIFVLQNGNFQVIKPETTFHVSFMVNQRYFVRQRERGLMTYENGRLRLLPDGELFASERVYAMLPYDENKVLIVSRGKGLYLYDGNGIEKFDSPDEKILVESQVYAGLPLPDGTYALASTQQGLFIVGKNGKILKNYNKESGLQNNSIYNLFLDKQQNLWMALEYGISFLKLNSPFEFFDERLNIEGGINHIELDTDENRLFLCTNKGLFTRNLNIDPKTKQNRFELIENTDGQSWFVRKVNEQWLFGHSEGLFQIKGKKAIRNAEVSSLISISPLGEYPGHLIGGSSAGLHTFESQKGNWSLKANLKGFEGYFEQFSFFQEDEQGFLWTSREDKGVMRLKLNNALDSLIFNKFFESSQHNLPSNLKIRVFSVNNRVVFATEKGIYRFNSKTNVFEKDPLDAYLSEPMRVFFLAEDSQGNIWFSAEKEIGVLLKQGGGKYKAYTKPFFKLLGENILYIRPVNANHAFFGTTNGLVFYNGKSVELLEKNMQNFSVLIRRVEKVSGNDPIVFGGNFVDKQLKLLDEQNAFQVPNLPFEVGYGLRFNFVATDYEENSKIQYQYYLEGFDSQWSAWTSRTDKEYTNLPEGRYTFHVRAKNMYQLQSKEAKYTFVILPPWYRTYWAYGVYIISFSLLIWAIINL